MLGRPGRESRGLPCRAQYGAHRGDVPPRPCTAHGRKTGSARRVRGQAFPSPARGPAPRCTLLPAVRGTSGSGGDGFIRYAHTHVKKSPRTAMAAHNAEGSNVQRRADDVEVRRWARAMRALLYDAGHGGQSRGVLEATYAALVARCRTWPASTRPAPTTRAACWPNGSSTMRMQFVVVLPHPDAALDNNLFQRSVRAVVAARKISGGSRGDDGVAARITLTSFLATWKARGLDLRTRCRLALARAPRFGPRHHHHHALVAPHVTHRRAWPQNSLTHLVNRFQLIHGRGLARPAVDNPHRVCYTGHAAGAGSAVGAGRGRDLCEEGGVHMAGDHLLCALPGRTCR